MKQELSFLSEFIRRIQIYEPSLIKNRLKQYEEYDFENAASAQLSKKVDVLTEDCLNHIMEFGQIGKEEADKFKEQVEAYRSLPDMTSTDSSAYKIRKQIAPLFILKSLCR